MTIGLAAFAWELYGVCVCFPFLVLPIDFFHMLQGCVLQLKALFQVMWIWLIHVSGWTWQLHGKTSGTFLTIDLSRNTTTNVSFYSWTSLLILYWGSATVCFKAYPFGLCPFNQTCLFWEGLRKMSEQFKTWFSQGKSCTFKDKPVEMLNHNLEACLNV